MPTIPIDWHTENLLAIIIHNMKVYGKGIYDLFYAVCKWGLDPHHKMIFEINDSIRNIVKPS